MLYISILSFVFASTLISQEQFNGYTLFTPTEVGGPGGGQNSNTSTLLIDVNENTVNSWSHSYGPASMPYLTQDSLLYYPYRVPNPTMDTGGVGGGVKIYNWEGDELWDYTLSNNNYQHHHDIEPLPNGNFLIIAWDRKYASEAYEMGRQTINNSLNQMWSESIFEIQPDFETGGHQVVWEWHLWDHLVQDRSPNYGATYGTISDHPELLDINWGNVGGGGGPGGANGDWRHHNAIHYNEHFDQIVISARHGDEIMIIDHSTTTEEAASHSGGNSGKGGDILYRWGNPESYGRGNSSWHHLNGQHGVNWIPEGSPGAGNLILYNNFYSNTRASVIELELPVDEYGNYSIHPSDPFAPANPTWEVNGTWQSDMQGGAFRQPNGNTLITDCDSSRLLEIDSNGTIVWSYYPPDTDFIARAQTYTLDYLSPSISGDLNGDEVVNILDVVSTVNIILGLNDFNQNADINNDSIVNILDIVLIINIILGLG